MCAGDGRNHIRTKGPLKVGQGCVIPSLPPPYGCQMAYSVCGQAAGTSCGCVCPGRSCHCHLSRWQAQLRQRRQPRLPMVVCLSIRGYACGLSKPCMAEDKPKCPALSPVLALARLCCRCSSAWFRVCGEYNNQRDQAPTCSFLHLQKEAIRQCRSYPYLNTVLERVTRQVVGFWLPSYPPRNVLSLNRASRWSWRRHELCR
ncbi:hypothetical protein B0T22DRAFT_464365 [Podospora appendiculata]|uniref:Uncharacterized protein n=1 Tax=Podospora appendiculata TaxID=314037 RepID=A0AAE0X4K2_9PEZI|nr:hypothetical protein B0T22DRAFT_464365 [Podospora appendiculata]